MVIKSLIAKELLFFKSSINIEERALCNRNVGKIQAKLDFHVYGSTRNYGDSHQLVFQE